MRRNRGRSAGSEVAAVLCAVLPVPIGGYPAVTSGCNVWRRSVEVDLIGRAALLARAGVPASAP